MNYTTKTDWKTEGPKVQNNFTELYNNKANALGADDNYVTDAEKVKLSNLSGTNTGDQDISGKADKTSFASQSAFTAAWGWTPGDNLGSATAANISSLFSGSGDCLKSDGTKGDCGTGAPLFLASLPLEVRLQNGGLSCECFEAGVNCGPSNGVKFLQRALRVLGYNVGVDGKIGNETLKAVNACLAKGHIDILVRCQNGEQYCYYKDWSKHADFPGVFRRT